MAGSLGMLLRILQFDFLDILELTHESEFVQLDKEMAAKATQNIKICF